MSDRDDIEVIDSAENAKSEDNTNSNNKFNQAIRQNPLTHSGEKSAKPGFFEKLKRAFSTDESPNDDVSDSEEQADGGLIDDGGIFGGFVNKFKRSKDDGINDDEEAEIEEITEMTVSVDFEADEEQENSDDNFDPEEEEEFRMISAFLEGEEYIPSEPEKSEEASDNDNKTKTTEVEQEKNIDSGDTEAESEINKNTDDTKVKSEGNGKSDDTEEKSEGDVKSDEIEVKSEGDEKSDDTEVKSEGDEKSDDTEVKSESGEKDDEIEVKSEGDEKSDDTEVKSESEQKSENTEVKTETDNSSDTKAYEYDVRDALENEEAEFDAQDAFENEEAEFVMIDIDEEYSVGVSEKDDVKSDDKTEEKNSEQADGENSESAKSESEVNVYENTDKKSSEDKPETERVEALNPNDKNSEAAAASDDTESEKDKDKKENEENKTENTENGKVKEISAEEAKDKKQEDSAQADIAEDDDEEFRFDDEFIFDESDDEEFTELTKLEAIDDFKDLDDIIDDKAKTEENPKSESQPESASENTEESSENTEAELKKNEEGECEKTKSEREKEEDKSEKSEGKVTAEEPEKSENEDTSAAASEKIKSDESKPEEEKSEVSQSSADKFVNISSDSGKKDNKQNKNNSLGMFKVIFTKTKNKLIELWSTKEEEPDSVKVSEIKPTAEALKNENSAEGGKANVTEMSPVDIKPAENVVEAEKTSGITDITADTVDTVQKTDISVESEKPLEGGINSDFESVFESDSEDTVIENKNTGDADLIDISKDQDNVSEEEKPLNVIPMTVIKNDNKHKTELDVDRMRESLNVIEGEKNNAEPDILTDEQKRQSELNQKVLEKVKQYEDETAEKREELRKAREERSARAYEKAFGTVDPITEIEITDYIVPGVFDEIKVKAGKFTESVRSEYEFYVGYSRLKNVAKKQAKIESAENVTTSKEQSKPSAATTEKDENRYAKFADDKFAKSRDRLDSISKRLDYRDSKYPDTIEYRSEDDAAKVKSYLQKEYKQSKLQWNVALALTFVMFILSCFAGKFTIGSGESAKDSTERIFAFLNIAIYGAMLYNCRDIIVGGLLPLKKIKSNSDTSTAVAAAVTAVQSLFALIAPSPFLRQGLNVYTLLVMLALSVNALGRNMNAHRIVSNFRFVSDSSQKYTGKFFHDQRMVATLLSGTRNDKSELVFQKKTSFLKHFVKLSYSPDPGEELADKFSLPTIIFSVIISVVYGFIAKSFLDAVSVLCVMLCAAVPMCAKALGAIPLHKLAKNSLANQSMVVGYQAVDNFSESAAVMIDAKELYPEGSVHLNGIKTFDSRRIDDAMLAAASVIITAGGAMAGMFDGIIQGDKQENLPTAEGVMYEDGKGLIGWVNNERIFVGNRKLLIAHGIDPMTEDYEDEQKDGGNEILYLACAGELVAMFIVGYSANRRVADALRRMEANGMSLLIRTTDVNITADRIAKDFGISHRSIKILEQKNSNVIRDEMIGKEKTSPAFIATKGGVTSFGRAVSGCIQTKRNISLSLAVQIVGVLLGLLIVTLIVLFAGVHHVGAIQLFMFYLFWVIAVLAAPPIIQQIQKY